MQKNADSNEALISRYLEENTYLFPLFNFLELLYLLDVQSAQVPDMKKAKSYLRRIRPV
jgi:hypothetical protein